jgi:hypothetical protein
VRTSGTNERLRSAQTLNRVGINPVRNEGLDTVTARDRLAGQSELDGLDAGIEHVSGEKDGESIEEVLAKLIKRALEVALNKKEK